MEYTSETGRSALITAAEKGHEDLTGYLISNGADLNKVTTTGSTALMFAIEQKMQSATELLIERGADINASRECGDSILIIALAEQQQSTAEILIELGADVCAVSNNGHTPLMFAAMYGYFNIVRMLLRRGADPDQKTDKGTTALDYAIDNGHRDVSDWLKKITAPTLIKGAGGVKTYSSSEWGLSFKYPATWNMIFENDTSGSWSIPVTVGGEMRGGQRPAFMVNARRDEMITPPHVTVTQALVDGSFHTSPHSPMEHNEDSQKSLPGYFDDIRFMDSAEIRLKGGVPAAWMVYSYSSSDGSVTELSVTAFCRDITYQFICDMPSSEQGHYMVIFGEILESIDITYPPIEITWTVPENIRIYGRGNPVKKEVTPDKEQLRNEYIYAVVDGDIAYVKEQLDKGLNVNTRYDNGATALIYAALMGHHRICDLLIGRGIDVHAKDDGNINALMTACESKNPCSGIVNLLLSKGVNVNDVSKGGATALMAAAKLGNTELVRILLNHGAEIDAQNNRSVTPLIWAASEGHFEVAKLLLEHGANIEIRSDGYTAEKIAEENRHYDIAELLHKRKM